MINYRIKVFLNEIGTNEFDFWRDDLSETNKFVDKVLNEGLYLDYGDNQIHYPLHMIRKVEVSEIKNEEKYHNG